MREIFDLDFMKRALLASLLVGCLASYFSVFVVQRRMSFLGSGLSHAAFGGIALGLLLGLKPLAVAIPFTLMVAWGIDFLKKRSKLNTDTLIGVFFSVSMALGIVFLSMRQKYSVEAMTYLFGSILSVDVSDLYIGGGLFILSTILLPLWPNWAYASFDSEMAKADRMPIDRDNLILTFLLAITVVISSKILGIVLMAASLVIPGAAARLLSQSFLQMTLISVLFGILSGFSGLVLSYYLDIPSGATIVLTQSLIFFGCFSIQKLLNRRDI